MVSPKIYLGVFAALLALTALTTAIAFVDLGGVGNVAVALSIAIVKAALVALYSSHLTMLFVTAGVFWLGILLGLTLSDYISRGWVSLFEAALS